MTATEQQLRDAERRLFAAHGLDAAESFLELPTGRVRLLEVGSGTPVVFLHGVTLAAAAWAPLLPLLPGYRALLVELPGHGLSGAATYRVGRLREQSLALVDDLLAALDQPRPAVVGHSLGGMLALWDAAARPGRIASLVVVGEPAVALPGVTVRMPLSLLTVPVVGELVQRLPSSRAAYRRLLAGGLGRAAVANAPDELVDVLRLAARRRDNARTVASLMHALNQFRRPRPESVLQPEELRRIATPTLFCLGSDDVYLDPATARTSIELIEGARVHELPAGHAPWLDDPAACAAAIAEHLSRTVEP